MLTEDKLFTYIPYVDTKDHVSEYLAIYAFCKALGVTGRTYIRFEKNPNRNLARIVIHLEEYNIIVGDEHSKMCWLLVNKLSHEVLCCMRDAIVEQIYGKNGIDCDFGEIVEAVDNATEVASNYLKDMTKEEFNKIVGVHNVRK